MKKAQAASELVVIAAFMLLVLFLLFEFGENKILQSTSVVQVSQARNTVDRLAKAATEVHNEGVGARRKIYVTIPDRVNSNRILIGNGTITLGVYVDDGTSDISSQVDFPVMQGSYFPNAPGSYWVWVISREGYVQIGNSLEINPMSVYLEVFPTNSTNQNITFTNYGVSTINVSLNLSLVSSEVNVTINNTNNLNFSLLPGSSNTQMVLLNVIANSNASRGLRNGYITVATNISESEVIPVMINVVAPPTSSGDVSYLTIDTYNDSAYVYSDGVFYMGESVYHRVKSYNSTDNLRNSTVTVRIYDSSSTLVSQKTYSANGGTGIYNDSYSLAVDAPIGLWKITAYEIGGATVTLYFAVTALPSPFTTISLDNNSDPGIPFTTSQRVICRDSSNYIHVVWRYNTTQVRYAKSTDNGATFTVNTSFYASPATESSSKSIPSISCNGNNITVAYIDQTSGVLVAISTDNGNTWTWKNPVTTDAQTDISVERRGQRIYVVYQTSFSTDADIKFINSTDGGTTWPTAGKTLWLGYTVSDPLYAVDYFTPTIAVNGTGTSSDMLYVATWRRDIDEMYNSLYYIEFNKSFDAGANWGPGSTIKGYDTTGLGYPSLTFNSSHLLITYYGYSAGDALILLNSSSNRGSTWTGQQVSVGTNYPIHPTVSLNNTMPWVVWRSGSTPTSARNISYRNYNGAGWDGVIDYAIGYNNYPNAKWDYSGNCVEFVFRNGTALPYNIIYTHLGTCTSP